MISVELPKVELCEVPLQTISLGFNRGGNIPFGNVDNLLLEDGANFLLEEGGCILINGGVVDSMDIYYEICTNIGYIGSDGIEETKGDGNWIYSDYIPIYTKISGKYKIYSHNAISSLTFYDKDKKVISTLRNDKQGESTIEGDFISPEGAAFFRVSGGSYKYNEARRIVPYFIIY